MDHDVIIIGSGHNGLVAAATLARRGKRVLVLERNATFGGRMSAYAPFSGHAASPCLDDAGRLRPALERRLGLERNGFRYHAIDPLVFAPTAGDGASLTLWRNESASRQEIARFSKRDADRFSDYLRFMRTAARFAEQIVDMAPPALETTEPAQIFDAARLGLRFRMLGTKDMVRMMRLATQTCADFLDEWFETPLLKAVLAAPALSGGFVGPHAPGTAGLLAWRHACGLGYLSHGGTGIFIDALVDVCHAAGVELRTNAEVREVLHMDGEARGVRLADGTVLEAPVVVADTDPKHAVLDLLGAGSIHADFAQRVQHIKSRGICARMFLSLRELPQFARTDKQQLDRRRLAGRIHFGADLHSLERAFDDAKYGRWSREPMVEMYVPSLWDKRVAPPGRHLVSMTVAAAPYRLAEGSWDVDRDRFADDTIDFLTRYMPNLRDVIVERKVMTPLDLSRAYGLNGGHMYHGEIALDQLFVARPVPGAARYETPLRNFYLCGAGTHPGGLANGASGALCAQEIAMNFDARAGARARNRRVVTTAAGIGLALVGAGLAAGGALRKLRQQSGDGRPQDSHEESKP